MWLTKRKSLAKAYYSMFTTRRKLGPCSRSAVYRTLGTHERSSAVTATTASRLKRGLCDNGANPVINILSSLLPPPPPLFRARHRKHPACGILGEEPADGDVVETDIFQQENAAKDRNHFPGSSSRRGGRKRRSFPNHSLSVAAVVLGRPLRSKLIESSVMRFRPLLSRNFNRPRGSGGKKEVPRSRANDGRLECLQGVIQLFYVPPVRGATRFARRGDGEGSALNRFNYIEQY